VKKALTLLVVICMFSRNVAFAQDLGNPAILIKQGQFDVGFQRSSMFKQGFEDYNYCF